MTRIGIETDEWTMGHEFWASLKGIDGMTDFSYRNQSEAKTRLKGSVLEALEEWSRARKHTDRAMVRCGDGTVLLVEYKTGWEYSIWPQDGRSVSSSGGDWTKEQAVEYATSHAEQCYGGVVSVVHRPY